MRPKATRQLRLYFLGRKTVSRLRRRRLTRLSLHFGTRAATKAVTFRRHLQGSRRSPSFVSSVSCASHREPPLPHPRGLLRRRLRVSPEALPRGLEGAGAKTRACTPDLRLARPPAWRRDDTRSRPGRRFVSRSTRRGGLPGLTQPGPSDSEAPPPAAWSRSDRGFAHSLGRQRNNVLFGFGVSKATAGRSSLGLLLTGRGLKGRRFVRRAASCERVSEAFDAGARGWRIESASLLEWLAASAPGAALRGGRRRRPGLSARPPGVPSRTPRATSRSPASTCLRAPRSSTSTATGGRTSSSPAGRQPPLPQPRGRDATRTSRRRPASPGQEGEGVGALAFDYDNDGWTDLYVTYLDRPNLLYRNRGDGTFEEVGRRRASR